MKDARPHKKEISMKKLYQRKQKDAALMERTTPVKREVVKETLLVCYLCTIHINI